MFELKHENYRLFGCSLVICGSHAISCSKYSRYQNFFSHDSTTISLNSMIPYATLLTQITNSYAVEVMIE